MMRRPIHPAAAPRYDRLFTGAEAILAAGAVAAVAGTAVSVYGAQQAGEAQSKALDYNRQLAQQNATIAEQQSTTQAAIDKQNTARRLGEITASFGAAGVDVNQGSPLDVLSDQAGVGEMTRQLDLYRGKLASAGYIDSANLYGAEAAAAQQAGELRAGSTLLTGVSSSARAARGITF